QRLDALFLRISGSGSLCLFGVTSRRGEITCCRLDASLSQISVNSLRKSFGNLFENLHSFTSLLLVLQLSTIRIELRTFGDLEGMIPDCFCLIRPIQRFEDVCFGTEILEPFLILN